MMKFGKFKNLQHVSTHLPQINIPRAKKLLINTFQQFLLENPLLIEELKEYYFHVIKIASQRSYEELLTLLAKYLELPYFSEIKYSLTNYRLVAKVEFENSMAESLKKQLLSDLILLINLTFDFSKVDNNKVFSFISKIDYTLLRELLDSTIEIMNNAENINYEKLSKLFTIISQDENIFENLQNSKSKKKILLSIIK